MTGSNQQSVPNEYPGRMTREQGRWVADHAHEIRAVSIGLGSNGYPPGRDGWVLLTNDQSFWLSPEGEARKA